MANSSFHYMELDLTGVITPADRFEEYHKLNPQVYTALESMTRQLVNRGRTKIGIKMLFEVLRWEYYMNTNDPNSDFKINNNYAPYYARLLLQKHPEWDGIFELRAIRNS